MVLLINFARSILDEFLSSKFTLLPLTENDLLPFMYCLGQYGITTYRYQVLCTTRWSGMVEASDFNKSQMAREWMYAHILCILYPRMTNE